MKNLLIIPLLLAVYGSLAQSPARYSIIINELFADPTPSNGLPASEFIELYNRSAIAINLKGWKISDGSSTAVISSSLLLPPDSFLIVCPAAGLAAYSFYGRTVAVSSFPSLNNEGDLISLITADGSVMHAVSYTADWYSNPVKAAGGWTLELIDPAQACAGKSNWTASTHAGGGTPGRANAVLGTAPLPPPVQLLRAFPADSMTVQLLFNNSADSLSATVLQTYTFLPDLAIEKVIAEPPLFNTVLLRLKTVLQEGIVYTLTVSGLKSCSGSPVPQQSIHTGLPMIPEAGSLVVNEILFNPRPDGADYIELYNRSSTLINLGDCYLANRNSSGAIYNMERISSSPFLCFANEFPVASTDTAAIRKTYSVLHPAQLLQTALPSLPDDDGTIVLLNQRGDIIDEVHYSAQWHHPLIDNKEGVALERIDPAGLSQDAGNWTSAAFTAGFGTPTAGNSQFASGSPKDGSLYVDPPVFSPNQDGFQDRAGIYFRNNGTGTTARIRIFDARGIPVRTLLPIGTLQQEGVIWWDGTNEQQQSVSNGIYVLVAELFTPGGKLRRYKCAVTVRR